MAFIEVEDIEATLAKVETAGGAVITPKSKISDEHGYFATFKDPQGIDWSLWSKH